MPEHRIPLELTRDRTIDVAVTVGLWGKMGVASRATAELELGTLTVFQDQVHPQVEP